MIATVALALLQAATATVPSDAEQLKAALPALEILSATDLAPTYKPYLDCYVGAVDKDRRADLADDRASVAMLMDARVRCGAEERKAAVEARARLSEKAASAEQVDKAVEMYWRISAWRRLSQMFAARGMGNTYAAFMARVARGEVPSALAPSR